MAENSLPEERTEDPTEKRMGEIRRQGTLFVSQDVVSAITLLAGFSMLTVMWPLLVRDMKLAMLKSFTLVSRIEPFSLEELRAGFLSLVWLILPDILGVTLVVAAAATLTVMLQTNWNVKERKFKFNFGMLNPMNGIKRIFSVQGVVTTLKALLKLAIILPIALFYLKDFAPEMVKLMHLNIHKVFVFAGQGIDTLFWSIWWILVGFAIFDYFYGKHRWLTTNKMTKPEVKDERKAVEGDEATRRRIIQKGLQRIALRLRSAVPKAHVVVTNPTHISVALRYDRNSMAAPEVVAKGKGFIAMKIREIARENGIPVVERKPLARALFQSTEVGAMIPRELFRAAAEVFAYIFKLKNPHARAAEGGAR